MNRPRVSVLLPLRDEAPFLAECLDSLSAQTLSDFEVIAVDDGSTDATPAILDAHARSDSRYRILRQAPAGMAVEAALRNLWVECPLPGPGLTARAELVSYRDCGWPEDYDLVLRIWEGGGRFRNVDALVHRWRDHPERLTRTQPAYTLAAFRRCKVHFLRRTLLAGGRAAVVWGAGPTGKALARELLAAGTPLAAFVEVDLRKLGERIHGAPVVPVEQAADFPGTLALGAVSGPEGRARVRELAVGLGLAEGRDFVALA